MSKAKNTSKVKDLSGEFGGNTVKALLNFPKIARTYIISEKGTQFRKIGVSVDVRKRLSDLQTGNPRKLNVIHVFPGNVERSIHAILEGYSGVAKGEWFELTDSEVSVIVDTIQEMFTTW
jgi:hypothetical protein